MEGKASFLSFRLNMNGLNPLRRTSKHEKWQALPDAPCWHEGAAPEANRLKWMTWQLQAVITVLIGPATLLLFFCSFLKKSNSSVAVDLF